jgi:hypothetical protein
VDTAKLRGQVAALPGATPTTGVTARPLTSKPFTPQKPPNASAPQAATFGESETKPPRDPGAGAQMKPQAGRVEVPSLQTESRRVFHNPDGTFTAETTMGADRFKDAKGNWVGIDTSLVAGDRGRLRARSTDHPLEVAPLSDDAALGKIDLGAGVSFAFGIAGAARAKPQVDGPKATFLGVRQDADVELGPTADGLKEVLVLSSAQAPTSWQYPLTLTGLTAKIDGRKVNLVDKDGTVRAMIPPGSMMDSRPTTPDGFYASSDGVAYSLVTLTNGQQALQVDLDKAWLTAKERVFAVRVDPSVSTLLTGADDTFSAASRSAGKLSLPPRK